MNCDTCWTAVSHGNVMADEVGEVHYTFADNLAPYFLLIFSPIFVIICLFGVFYTYLTTEVRKLMYFLWNGPKQSNFELFSRTGKPSFLLEWSCYKISVADKSWFDIFHNKMFSFSLPLMIVLKLIYLFINIVITGFSRILSKSVLTMLLWPSCANLYTSVCGVHVF